ncbi:putative lipin, N-terminal conserved region/LNS2 (Lipin/Ned1/Smp2) [Leishmania naiffi]|uniref:Lipin, N-terminal conserved region/LNS2 (Lipin/Ned1/Smp2) n=1 Tax=Leishmania naiffi TaxID=5678 RepID=A0AAW3C549_9TRYP
MISTLGELFNLNHFNLNHFDQSSCANDVIVIRHKDGSLRSTPFNVRFGRAQMWSYVGRVVQVEVNGELTAAVMKIGKGGEAYWLQPTYGVFGDASHGATMAKHSEKAEGWMPPAAAAAAEVSGTSRGAKGDGEEVVMTGSFGNAAEEGETLAIDAVELQRLPILPESPLELPLLSRSDRADSERCEGTAALRVSPPSRVLSPGLQDSIIDSPQLAEENGARPLSSDAGHKRRLGKHSPGLQDTDSNLPLLHTADDGHLTIETRAIHSAGDAQEARLALRAVAAAEKSRKRLSRMGLGDDPYLLKTAWEEGHLGTGEDDKGELGSRLPEAPAAGIVVDAVDRPPCLHEAGVRAADDGKFVQGLLDTTPVARDDGTVVQTTEQLATQPAAEQEGEPVGPVPVPPSSQVLLRRASAVSSATSVTGSTDSYKVEDDDYFLDPIDTDTDYGAHYREEEAALLGSMSFESSVTSGVSLSDIATTPGTTAGDAVATLPRSASPSECGPCSAVEGNCASDASAALLLAPQTVAAATVSTKPPLSPVLPSSSPQAAGESQGSSRAKDAGKAAAFHTSITDVSTAKAVMEVEGRPVKQVPRVGGAGGGPYFTRTLVPVEADLWKLHLKEGCNAVRYLARKDKGDIVSISCSIFLWNWTDRLVVSDVDGTITKSDLLGHFYAMLGKGADWTHPGICNLFSKIERNGYRMVYLTARSVSQISQTKSYLFTLQQEGVRLPMGPVLTAPHRFFTALTQEVSKQSHVFKIACLTSVCAAFPSNTKPFFAGFGNRYNDVISYDAAGIPTHKIFIIDPSSVLHVCLVRHTYRDLGHLVDVTFPPVKRHPVVLRAPRHLQRAQGTRWATSPSRAAAAAAGRDRHAYAHSLLHGSTSASVISSAASSTSGSSDVHETASGCSSESEAEGASAMPPHHYSHHLQHQHNDAPHHTSGPGAAEGDDGRVSFHASAAFSLVDSVSVGMPDPGALGGFATSSGVPPELTKDGGPPPTAVALGLVSAPPFPTAPASVASWSRLPAAEKPGAPWADSASPAVKTSTSAGVVPHPKYNYGRHPVFAGLNNGDSGATSPAEEEEVPADPEFSSFVYWRLDPCDLITAPATTSTSSVAAPRDDTKGVSEKGRPTVAVNDTELPKKAAAAAASTEQNKRATLAAAAAAAPTRRGGAAGDAAISSMTSSRGVSTAASLTVAAAAVGVNGAADAAAPTPGGGDRSGSSLASLTASHSGSRSPVHEPTDLVNEGQMRAFATGAAAATTALASPETGLEAQPRLLNEPDDKQAADTSLYNDSTGVAETKAETAWSPPPQQSLPLPSVERPATTLPPATGGGGSRGFFAAFSFGRPRVVELPLSSTSKKIAQLREEARQRALSHPDARDYYMAQQQQQQQQQQQLASQPPPLPGNDAPAKPKVGTLAPLHK